MEICFLIWDRHNLAHIAQKGINEREIEEALQCGILDMRRGKLVRRGDNVIQRYCVIVKDESGPRFKVVLEPVDRGAGIWRCVTAWKMK